MTHINAGVRQNIWNFPVGIANNIFFILLFVGAGLYAGVGLQVVYLGLAGLGWYWWLRGGERSTPLTPSHPPLTAFVACVVAGCSSP